MVPRFIRVIFPPVDAVAAGLVHRRRSAGRSEPEVHPLLANGNIRIAAVENDPAGFVLIETKMNEAAEEVSGLRATLTHRRGDPPAQRIGGAGIVLRAVA